MLIEMQSMKLVERIQACAKLSSRKRVATLKNLKYRIYFDLLEHFFGYYMIPYVLFHSFVMSSLLFYNVENSKNKEKPLNE